MFFLPYIKVLPLFCCRMGSLLLNNITFTQFCQLIVSKVEGYFFSPLSKVIHQVPLYSVSLFKVAGCVKIMTSLHLLLDLTAASTIRSYYSSFPHLLIAPDGNDNKEVMELLLSAPGQMLRSPEGEHCPVLE